MKVASGIDKWEIFAWVFTALTAVTSLFFVVFFGWDVLNHLLSTPLASQLVSTVIAVAISAVFWWLGGKQLRREAENLLKQNEDTRRLTGLTIRILDEAELLPDNVEPTKDEAGNYTGGLTYKLSGTAQGKTSARGTLTVTHPDDANRAQQDPAGGEEPR